MASDENLEKLDYFVYKYSSYSPNYLPSNIKVNKPTDQTSRWSSETNSPPQFLLLKLSKFCIVQTITFGKYEKTHVCNLKKFKVYGGLTEDNMLELLDGGLKNDSQPETLHLRHKMGAHPFACRYIKIVPLQSWGSSFNFTVWYVHLGGVSNWATVETAVKWMSRYRQIEAIRVCMKYLRQMNYRDSLECLKRESIIELEDPMLSRLYGYSIEGSYSNVEEFMDKAIEDGLLNSYVSKQHYKPTWRNINVPKPRPGMRGGHQMCLDSYSETIYLLGGWDGYQDLADLWTYHIPTNKWTLISEDAKVQGGPSARSCHKMCLDPERRQIFVLGRYLDVQLRSQSRLKSDFYVFNIESNEWTQITDDTSAMGGPRLIFDHQMCMDVSTRTLYVFGGRVLLPAHNDILDEENGGCSNAGVAEPLYSGLYSYHVSTNTWKLICSDISANDGLPSLKSRVGHSMLFHPVSRNLYIFAGQRNKDYLNDFFSYNIDTGGVEYICEEGLTKDGTCLPAAGFTQRATIDPELDEIYVLSGLSKDKDKRDENIQNSFWVYYIKDNKWSCVYKNENESGTAQYCCTAQNMEPCPRFAHQLVYDQVTKIHFLFGGNPGVSAIPKLRLDDFWKLHFNRRTNPQLQRQCKLLIRTFRYKELSLVNSLEALHFLQNEVRAVLDHDSPTECNEKLPEVIFQDDTNSEPISDRHTKIHKLRNQMFDQLSFFFPESMSSPRVNLEELIQL
ncbi:muskelin 1 isoform X2 [Rhodnius prolixus]|uniref:muskelin 1 isoform X2 n=1 Tax=Rhodnius prolixus TaxID=13249 RepID=UPI003D18D3FE